MARQWVENIRAVCQDQNVAFSLTYRLSPHVTLVAQDRFLKTSNVLNQQNFASTGGVSGGAQARGGEQCSCGADHGEDRGWVFGGLVAAIRGEERVSDEEESEAEKKDGGFLH